MSRLMIAEIPSYSCEFKGIRVVAELVRCKECKHIYTMDCAFYEVGDNVKPDDFCSYGKVSEKPTGSEKPNNSNERSSE